MADFEHCHDFAKIVLEKRLGIAQLCLLLTVLVFMALTRGSRGGALISMNRGFGPVLHKSMRDWGRRTLSLSGDWVTRSTRRTRDPLPKIGNDLDGPGMSRFSAPVSSC
jgi:hypothetical protein